MSNSVAGGAGSEDHATGDAMDGAAGLDLGDDGLSRWPDVPVPDDHDAAAAAGHAGLPDFDTGADIDFGPDDGDADISAGPAYSTQDVPLADPVSFVDDASQPQHDAVSGCCTYLHPVIIDIAFVTLSLLSRTRPAPDAGLSNRLAYGSQSSGYSSSHDCWNALFVCCLMRISL